MKQLLKDFDNYLSFLSPRSKKSYRRYVENVDRENEGMTLQWLKDAATNADPLGELSKKFDNFFSPKQKPSKKTKLNWKTGLLTLGKFVFGFNESSINLQSIKNFDLEAANLSLKLPFSALNIFMKMSKMVNVVQKITNHRKAMLLVLGSTANIEEQIMESNVGKQITTVSF